MSNVGIVFPHQLFEDSPLINTCSRVYLVEEWLFFQQYLFHKRKIAFHRASMKFYEVYLQSKNIEVVYIDSTNELSDILKLVPHLKKSGIEHFEYIDTTDNWLEKRIIDSSNQNNIGSIKRPSPLFINSIEEITTYFKDKKKNVSN